MVNITRFLIGQRAQTQISSFNGIVVYPYLSIGYVSVKRLHNSKTLTGQYFNFYLAYEIVIIAVEVLG
jgi:hypothetical protein